MDKSGTRQMGVLIGKIRLLYDNTCARKITEQRAGQVAYACHNLQQHYGTENIVSIDQASNLTF